MAKLQFQAYQYMIAQHDVQFFFFCAKPVIEILNTVKSPVFINYEQEINLAVPVEEMRRFYKTDESRVRLRNYLAYYAEDPEYLRPNFPVASQHKLMMKRKRRLYKLQKRHEGDQNQSTKNIEKRKTVLHQLNKKSVYLMDILVGNSSHSKFSDQNQEDLKPKEIKCNPLFINASVHDIYDPVFTDDEEPIMGKSLTITKQSQMNILPSKLSISFKSKDLMSKNIGDSDCSDIRDMSKLSNEKILDDFSLLIHMKDLPYHRSPTEAREKPSEKELLSDSNPLKITKKKIDFNIRNKKPLESHDITKVPTPFWNRKKVEKKSVKNEQIRSPITNAYRTNSRINTSEKMSICESNTDRVGMLTDRKPSIEQSHSQYKNKFFTSMQKKASLIRKPKPTHKEDIFNNTNYRSHLKRPDVGVDTPVERIHDISNRPDNTKIERKNPETANREFPANRYQNLKKLVKRFGEFKPASNLQTKKPLLENAQFKNQIGRSMSRTSQINTKIPRKPSTKQVIKPTLTINRANFPFTGSFVDHRNNSSSQGKWPFESKTLKPKISTNKISTGVSSDHLQVATKNHHMDDEYNLFNDDTSKNKQKKGTPKNLSSRTGSTQLKGTPTASSLQSKIQEVMRSTSQVKQKIFRKSAKFNQSC